MRETDFIEQNKSKWIAFEQALNDEKTDPEKLNRLFIETTDDLSYSRTFYANRSVRVYLNGMAQRVFQLIYRNKRSRENRFRTFWLSDLPQAMWFSRKELLVAFLVFVMGLAIGMMSSNYNPEFVEIMLGERYVEMTKSNIENGDPMAVYKDSPPTSMFLGIAWNNVRVAFLTFVCGVFFSAGTLLVLIYNSIMVGAFIYFFIQRDLFTESIYTIMLHGTLELSCIVLAGCAGLALGRGLIFPGTYSRGQAFLLSARRGIRIMMGVAPVLIFAAFIEGFGTRYTETPDIFRGMIIFLSAFFIAWYFVYLPYRLRKKGRIEDQMEEHLQPSKTDQLEFERVKSIGQMFTELFVFYKNGLSKVFLYGVLVFVVGAAIVYGSGTYFYEILSFNIQYGKSPQDAAFLLDDLNDFFDYQSHWQLFPLGFVFFTLSLFSGNYIFEKYRNKELTLSRFTRNSVLDILVVALIISSFFFLPWYLCFLCFVLMVPFLILSLYCSIRNKVFIINGMGMALRLLKHNFWRMFGLFTVITLVQYLILLLVNAPLFYFNLRLISMNIPSSFILIEDIPFLFYAFMSLVSLTMIFPMYVFGFNLLYYHCKEVNEANHLRMQIATIGTKKRAYGLEKES